MRDKMEEKIKPKDLKEQDEQIEYIEKLLSQDSEDEEEINMDLGSRMGNRLKYLDTLTKAKHQRKGDFWITVPPKMFISKLIPSLTKDQAKITFFVYEWDEKDHNKKKEVITFTEIPLSDGTLKKVAFNGEPVTKYQVIERLPRNGKLERQIIDTKKYVEDYQEKIQSGKIKIRE